MPLDPSSITTLIFDYGNTLIEFGRQQVDSCDGRISAELRRLFGPHDEAHFRQMRDRDRFSPYQGDHREQDLRAMAASWVTDLYGRKSEREHVDSLLAVRHAALVDAIRAPDYLHDLLARLQTRFRLGLLSNYPDGPAIRASLRRIGIEGFFSAIVVSGEVGYVKPHPRPFTEILQQLGSSPGESLIVGDNWLGDIQGGKRLGLRAIHTRQFVPYEIFDRQAEDHEPDGVVEHLLELQKMLIVG